MPVTLTDHDLTILRAVVWTYHEKAIASGEYTLAVHLRDATVAIDQIRLFRQEDAKEPTP